MARWCGRMAELPECRWKSSRHSWTLVLCCGLVLLPGLLEASHVSTNSQRKAVSSIDGTLVEYPRESSNAEPVRNRLKLSDDISDHKHSDSAVDNTVAAGAVAASSDSAVEGGVSGDTSPALTSATVISDSPAAWAPADLSPLEVRSGQRLSIVPVSLVQPSDRVRRSVTPSVRGTQDTSDRVEPERQARAATVIGATTTRQTAASPWQPEASFDAEPRTGRESKPDVNSVLSSIISLLGDNVRLVGPPADRAPDRGPNRHRPRPGGDRPLPTRINNRGPPQQFVPVKNRPAPPVKTRPAVRPYPSHLPPPLRPRPGQRPPPPPSNRPQRPPIAPYAVGIPLPERLVPFKDDPVSPTVATSVRQTVVTDQLSSEAPSATPTLTPSPSTVSSTATNGAAPVATAVPSSTPPPPPPATEAETTEAAVVAEGGAGGGSSEEKVESTERETTTEAGPEVTTRPSAAPRPEEVATPPQNTADETVTTTPAPRPVGPADSDLTPDGPLRLPGPGPVRDRPWVPERTPERAPEKAPERTPVRTPEKAPERTPVRTPERVPERKPTQETPTRDDWVEIPSTANVPLSGSESSPPELGDRPARPGRPSSSATPPLSSRPTGTFPGSVLDARPGVVVDATRRRPPRPQIGRPQVINAQRLGDVFDITVSAAQGGFGGGPVRRPPRPQPPSGQPYVIPVDINNLRGPGDIITEPDAVNNVVSIDGRRTYFDLAPTDTNAGGTYQTVGAGLGPGAPPTGQRRPGSGQRRPSTDQRRPSAQPSYRPSAQPSYQTPPQWPQQPAAEPEQQQQQWPQQAASIYPGQRRRPSPPPIRIDTCIVGDDSTCKREYNERCKTEDGVSSCHCRPGFNRLRPRTACKRVVSVVMTMKVDGIGESRLAWQAALRNPNSEVFQQLAWDAEHAITTSMSGTTMRDIYMGNKVTSFYLLRGGVALNTTVSLLDTTQTRREQVTDELQRQMNRAIRANDNLIGDSSLFVEGPSSPVPRVLDLDECENADQHDCDENAECSNVFGSFTCRCKSGYDDRYRKDEQKAGRYCDSCTDDYCSDRGTCQIFDGEKTCQCRGAYYGAQCEIDGEVLGAALGATAAAAVIIIATFICLCKWSKRWHKGQGHTKVEMGTLGAASGYSFMKPSAAAAAHANFQMGVEERLRWAQMAEAIGRQNLYAPEPLYGGGGVPLYASQPNLPGTLQDGPASLNLARAGRGPFPPQVLRSMTPAYSVAGERPPVGVPMGRSARTPLPHPPVDDDGPTRPRSRGSMAYDYSTLSAHDFPLQGTGGGSQQQLVYSSGRPRHRRSSSRDSIYETLSPHLTGGSGATQLLTFDPKRDDKLFEKSNSWRMAF
ncbi:nascent polypeptide-associated complex subunit alpha, muscle-specific form-like isoform X1 [Amphibalanus amphitrite]|uniref:nascent polypeptide-associated complex subunit alpha, muscle-specific form-like isoform X1 n=1 Tax=Amphibalanus amphitrite TaxID=1232801 RepID=UPI001C92B844|nr:nascent polypeptide-associated complex subunit alpha, muscle-specific form-like isoform X1 [Amphibalanus amphitrite]